MRLDFIETRENGYLAYYTIATDVVYQGKLHEELWWNEMKVRPDGQIEIIWQDDWKNSEILPSLPEAKVHVSRVHIRHTPISNGKSFVLKPK